MDALDGGVVSKTMFFADPDALMMSFILPDDDYAEYVRLLEAGDRKAAKALIDRKARSVI